MQRRRSDETDVSEGPVSIADLGRPPNQAAAESEHGSSPVSSLPSRRCRTLVSLHRTARDHGLSVVPCTSTPGDEIENRP